MNHSVFLSLGGTPVYPFQWWQSLRWLIIRKIAESILSPHLASICIQAITQYHVKTFNNQCPLGVSFPPVKGLVTASDAWWILWPSATTQCSDKNLWGWLSRSMSFKKCAKIWFMVPLVKLPNKWWDHQKSKIGCVPKNCNNSDYACSCFLSELNRKLSLL